MNEKYVVFIQIFLNKKKTKLAVGPTDRSPTASFFNVQNCKLLTFKPSKKKNKNLGQNDVILTQVRAKKITADSSCPAATARAARLEVCSARPRGAHPLLLSSFPPRELCAAHALNLYFSIYKKKMEIVIETRQRAKERSTEESSCLT